jgi:hypothetical protein
MELKKYVCDICGYIIEDTPEGFKLECPVCKGKLIPEEKIKEKEEMENMVGENKDEDLTPEQDANEVIDDYIIERMAENIAQYGNDKTWYNIENCMFIPEQRIIYRKFFFLAGGVCPEGAEIK